MPEPEPPPSAGETPRIDWADAGVLREPEVAPSLEWAALQLVPSPELGYGDNGAIFGLRWQLTPLLYSFATDARLRPWRSFVVEPIVRQSGSVELYLSPEYLALEGGIGEAPRVLRELLPAHGLDEQRVAILRHGEQRVFLARD